MEYVEGWNLHSGFTPGLTLNPDRQKKDGAGIAALSQERLGLMTRDNPFQIQSFRQAARSGRCWRLPTRPAQRSIYPLYQPYH